MEGTLRGVCLVGAAQRTWRDGAPEPLDQWAEVASVAAGGALRHVDSLQVVYCQSWQYDDPVGRLADALGIEPRHRIYSGIGGTTPQVLVNEAASAIARSDYDVALIVGAEALATKRRLKRDGVKPDWRFRDPERKPFPFEAPFHPAEVAHEVFQAWLTFPLFDVARRARLGVEPEAYRRALGDLLAPMTEVAAANPHAWFPTAWSADELINPRADNRMVAYPYTKRMVAVMDVDMAAAVVVASDDAADRLGVPGDERVHVRGWGYATDPVYVAEHDDLSASPAMAAASTAALHMAGMGIDDVAHLDLYSCFASSLNLACDALGISDRSLTVTGGLPYAGGPASNYVLHAIATMVDVLRRDPGSVGMVSGVGMHMTKHVFGVYSTTPGEWATPSPVPEPTRREITDHHDGPATIATYSVVHARTGEPEWGLAVVDLPDGRRAYARTTDPDLLAALEAEEWVGRHVELRPGPAETNELWRVSGLMAR